jgi:hypothetical protein
VTAPFGAQSRQPELDNRRADCETITGLLDAVRRALIEPGNQALSARLDV